MIQPQELRIGNLLQDDKGNICTVRRLSREDEEDILIEEKMNLKTLNYDVFGIPLTEEILLKFGFNKEYQKGYIGIDVCNSDFVLTEPLKMGEWQTNYTFQFETGSVPKFKEIEYVHQLQNIFFALNGEELTFKKD